MASRPRWLRLDTDYAENPKLVKLKMRRHFGAIALWPEALAYSVRHLTDGWIPEPMPGMWGYRPSDPLRLVEVELWIPMEYGDAGGWLIKDYADYQPSREHWQQVSEAKRKAAAARWQAENGPARTLRPVQ